MKALALQGGERMNIADNLKRIRGDRGFTQVEVSDRSGVPLDTLRKIEAGGRNSRIDTLEKLARSLDVTVNDLLVEQKAQAS